MSEAAHSRINTFLNSVRAHGTAWAVTSDRNFLAVAVTEDWKGPGEFAVQIWHLTTGQQIDTIPFHHRVTDIAFTRDDRYLYVKSGEKLEGGWRVRERPGEPQGISLVPWRADDLRDQMCRRISCETPAP